MPGSYNYALVALSILISVGGAFAVLDLARQISDSRAAARLTWLFGGAAAIGINTMAMHYTAMAGFSLPVLIRYDVASAAVSFVAAFCAAAVTLLVVSRTGMGWLATLAGSTFVGGGMAALHYTAMTSMRFEGTCRYAAAGLTLSVLAAILLSFLALRLLAVSRANSNHSRGWEIAAVLLLGSASPAMHYSAMAATVFTRTSGLPDHSFMTSINPIGSAAIVSIGLLVPWICRLNVSLARLRTHSALLAQLFEQAPQAIVLLDAMHRIVGVNREFSGVFGYTLQEAVGRTLAELIVPEELRDQERSYRESVEGGELIDAEVVRRRKNGSRLEVSMLRVPVSLPRGETVDFAIYRDITSRKRMENELLHSFEQMRALTAHLQTVREEERTRVAREIHDELGQDLTAIKIQVSSIMRGLPADPGQAEKTESTLQLIDDTIQSVRRISTDLRTQIPDDLGLLGAIEWAGEEFENRTGVKCRLDLPREEVVTDRARAAAVFRIFQESLTNIARHASAAEVNVRLARENGSLILQVDDNGKGLPTEALSAATSIGILGMRERASLVGGELIITSIQGKGTTVKVRVPDTVSNTC